MAITAAQTDAGSPIDQQLMDAIRTALDGARPSARIVVTGPLNALYEVLDGYWMATGDFTLDGVRIVVGNSGTSGQTGITFRRDGTSGAATRVGNAAHNTGGVRAVEVTFGTPLALASGDYIWADITELPGGDPEDLTLDPLITAT